MPASLIDLYGTKDTSSNHCTESAVDTGDHTTADTPSSRDSSCCRTDDFRTLNDPTDEQTHEEDKLEPIAVIGFSLRFPQDATSSESFWRMMVEGRSARTDVPSDRFNIDAFYQKHQSEAATINAKGGHFVKEDIARFDAPFFTMTPAEAECVDPMQRWLLETTYEALENAGISIDEAAGSKTSVHIGAYLHEYEMLLSRDPQMVAKHKSPGTAVAMLANRLSWFYDLKGPSLAIDTACSSSLHALHLACQSLRSRESTMGIVGGCNLFYNPDTMTSLTDLNFISPDSISYSFDHRANGYSRGEGFGVTIVKPLSSALRDGNTIRAVIRSSGANQDGKTPVITQPSSRAQEMLIRETYEAGGLDMAQTRYFEAHGTGTPIGDPLEAKAIHAAFKEVISKDKLMVVGAVKSMIGHLEGAAGIASLIKSILVLENGIIPPNIGFERVNPKIPADKWHLKFPTEPTPWPSDELRRASVNSFGFGGANAHVVLDDAYNYLKNRNLSGKHCTRTKSHLRNDNDVQSLNEHARLYVFSAADDDGISRLSDVYQKHLQTATEDCNLLDNLAYTLSEKRSRLQWKSFAIARSVGRLRRSLVKGLSNPIRSRSGTSPKVGFVFTGQGAQWHAMGRELLDSSVFARTIDYADKFFRILGSSWSLLDELKRSDQTSRLSEAAISQPACTAIQIALAKLLRSWNILPTAVVGHSSGEIAAAYCSGGLSEDSALKVAYHRGLVAEHVKEATSTDMAMLAVGLSEAAALDYLEKSTDSEIKDLTVACINSPKSVTLSGTLQSANKIIELFEKDGIFARLLKVDIAYHSRYMEIGSALYQSLISTLEQGLFSNLNPVMYSSINGQAVDVEELSEPRYWVRNLVSPVRFLQAVSNVCSDAPKVFDSPTRSSKIQVDCIVEIGPHAALQGPLKDILHFTQRGRSISYGSVLVRHKRADLTALEIAGSLHCMGYKVDLVAVNNRGHDAREKEPSMLTNLPPYPFNHSKRYWLESRLSKNYRFRQHPHHDLLGSQVTDWNPLEARWRNFLSLESHPWVKHHKVNGIPVYPAAGMLVAVMEGMRQFSSSQHSIAAYRFKDVTIRHAITLRSKDTRVETELCIHPSAEQGVAAGAFLSWNRFKLFLHENEKWLEVCSGFIALESEAFHAVNQKTAQYRSKSASKTMSIAKQNCTTTVSPSKLYDCITRSGISYGPSFATLHDIRHDDSTSATAQVDLLAWKSKIASVVCPNIIHPAALDAVQQLSLAALSHGAKSPLPTLVPTVIREMWIAAPRFDHLSESGFQDQGILTAHAKPSMRGFRNCSAELVAVDSISGAPRIVAEFEATALEKPVISTANSTSEPIAYNIEWKPDVEMMDAAEILHYCAEQTRSIKLPPRSSMRLPDKLLYCNIMLWRVNQSFEPKNQPEDKPVLKKYAEWMKHRLSEKNIAPQSPTSLAAFANDESFVRQLEDSLEANDAEGKVIVRVGKHMEELIYGKTDVLELLFNDGVMSDFYRLGNDRYSVMHQIQAYVDACAHRNPTLRILEIGGGTASATRAILKALSGMVQDGTPNDDFDAGSSRFEQYTFTDISPSFFPEAKQIFKELSDRMKYTVLDIGKDPLPQGLNVAGYDLIIASNVLHATPDIRATLRHVQKLLAPGGKLILHELTNPDSVRHGFSFGYMAGWWLSDEKHRKWCPLMYENEWESYLVKSGFSGIDFKLKDYDDEDGQHGICAMICTKPIEPPQTHASPTYIIHTDVSQTQKELGNQLQADYDHLDFELLTLSDVDNVDLKGATCVFLPEIQEALLGSISHANYRRVQKMVCSSDRILWASSQNDPTTSMVDGLRRVVSREFPLLQFASLSMPFDLSTAARVQHISRVLTKLLSSRSTDVDLQYSVNDGLICIPRIVKSGYMNRILLEQGQQQSERLVSAPFKTGHSRALKLTLSSFGALDTVHFVDDIIHNEKPLGASEIEIEVVSSGLNFKDVLMALGQVPEFALGIECAGYVSRTGDASGFREGDRVCAIVEGSLQTFARCDSRCAVKVPQSVSLSEAAAMPIIYSTAYYALYDLGRLKSNESVLIHSGAGGLGQAAIQLAQRVGAVVFTTVGTDAKKQHLMALYGIPGDHIFSSRSSDFVAGIKGLTNGKGVDVVMNNLTGEGLRSSWECVAPFGRFVEVGRKDIDAHGVLPLAQFSRGVTFSSVDLRYMEFEAPDIVAGLLDKTMKLLADKEIGIPGPQQVFGVSQIEEAMRILQSGKNMGKIVIDLRPDDVVQATPNMQPKYEFDPNSSYVIAGGLGGLGRSIAQWMVSRGARNLILLSRSGARKGSAQSFLSDMRGQGINIAAPCCDITDKEALTLVLAECGQTMPPIQGCIHSGMILQDSRFDTMTHEEFETATRPKVAGSWNLHECLPSKLNFFILLSSSSGLSGWHGQANYAAGTTYQDGLARHLVETGQRPQAVALDLGAVDGAGYVFEKDGLMPMLQNQGVAVLAEQQLHTILDYYCSPNRDPSTCTPLHAQLVTGIHTPQYLRSKRIDTPSWMYAPLFSHVFQMRNKAINPTSTVTSDETNYAAQLAKLTIPGDSVAIASLLSTAIQHKLAKMLAIGVEDVDISRPAHMYGVDSLAAVEVRNWMKRSLGCQVAVFDILGNDSVETMGKGMVNMCKFVNKEE